MSRSKKWRLEWSFFLGENGRRRYNKICKGCVHPASRASGQSSSPVPITSPHARKSVQIRVENGLKNRLRWLFREPSLWFLMRASPSDLRGVKPQF